MPSIKVCSRVVSSKAERFNVTVEGLDSTVETLEQEVQKQLDTLSGKPVEFDLIYCGQVLLPASTLSSYRLKENATVYAIKKFTSRSNQKIPQPSEGATSQPVVSDKAQKSLSLLSSIMNAEYKNIVEQFITDTAFVDNLTATIPGLKEDPAVLAMIQQPEILVELSDSNNIARVLEKHPSLAETAIKVTQAVTEEAQRRGIKAKATAMFLPCRCCSHRVTYSLDQMSDDEDDAPRAQRSGAGNPGGSNITTSLLAAAIQAVTGSGSLAGGQGGAGLPPGGGAAAPFSMAPNSQQMAPGPSGSGSSITSDFFQQAMAHAQSASTDTGLQQLREMGITDENVARQALAATGGDIQAAIDLIFSDGFM